MVVKDEDKKIFFPMSFLEQMTWLQESISENILNKNILNEMRNAGIERFGAPGYGSAIKRLLEIIKADPKNRPLLREVLAAERELLSFIYDEVTDITEDCIRDYWDEYLQAYCYVIEQNNCEGKNG